MIARHPATANTTAPIMNTLSRLSLLAASCLALTGAARAQSASYLETIPLTFLWNFNLTGVSGTTIGNEPLTPEQLAQIDPDRLRPVDRVTTENGVPIGYDKGSGNQAFLVRHLLRALLDRDNPTITEEDAASTRWELTAVRAPQTSLEGVTSTPYQIFLTRKDPTVIGRPGQVRPVNVQTDVPLQPSAGELTAINTGLSITLGASVANVTETLAEGVVTKASGSVTTAFSLTFGSIFYDDPRFPLLPFDSPTEEDPEPKIPVAGVDYWSKRNVWSASATGYMTYSLRSTTPSANNPAAVAPTKIKATGVGSWFHIFQDLNPENANSGNDFSYGGIAPLSIKMGEVKYQNRNLFPGFSEL
jgi:hypothetical protein